MTTFKGIRGTTIEVLSSDPSNPEIGQIWYNSSSGTLKGYKQVNVWASGGTLNTARTYSGGAGISTAAIVWAGQTNPPGFPSFTQATELYNGTNWTSGSNYPIRVNGPFGLGTQTATLGAGGYIYGAPNTGITATFNGSAWTQSPNSLNTVRQAAAGTGTQTAGIANSGSSPGGNGGFTELWNGTSWTNTTTSNTTTGGRGLTGTQTAALAFAGGSPFVANTESFNGSTWTNLNSMNTARSNLGYAGTQTSALGFGGYTPSTTSATELWNGTAWTSNPTGLATSRAQIASGNLGSQSSALAIGGRNSPAATPGATELWTGVGTKTITAS
jgi:hypothetical protein